ncbi:alanine racemase [soil metagenome]
MDVDRNSAFHRVIAEWGGRTVFAVIDLDALAVNVRTVLNLLGPDAQLMAVVKANGYGHGAVAIAKTALGAGAAMLGVATVDEGCQIRLAGVDAPILVLGAIGDSERASAIGNRLGLVVSDAAFARGLASVATATFEKEPVSVHLKIDTGMRRFGAMPEDGVGVAQAIASLDRLRLDGVMSHFASADSDDDGSVHEQAARFDQCVGALRAAGIVINQQHLTNSAATLRYPEHHREMVRLGIAMYGLSPGDGVTLPSPMKPVLTIHGRISRMIDLAPGDRVGYGGAYRATGQEQAALVALGYADGYRRSLSEGGSMSIRGRKAEVIGRVSMDQTVVRVPRGLEIAAGEPIAIVGDDTNATVGASTLDELAAIAGTIGYEMATGLAPRLPRLYLRSGEVVAISDLAGYRELL